MCLLIRRRACEIKARWQRELARAVSQRRVPPSLRHQEARVWRQRGIFNGLLVLPEGTMLESSTRRPINGLTLVVQLSKPCPLQGAAGWF